MTGTSGTARKRMVLAGWLAVIGLAAAAFLVRSPAIPAAGRTAVGALPAPALDESSTGSPTTETAVLAGGCFWGVEGVFQHIKGVSAATSGYAGGDQATAHYDTVSTGTTKQAESVRISYDPTQVTFGQLLRVFFGLVQDPTELNYQGPDVGPQYRSVIFTQNDSQQKIARAYIAQLNAAGVFPSPIVTTVTPGAQFFPAEPYHQNFLALHPNNPYIVANDLPKLDALKSDFPDLYRD